MNFDQAESREETGSSFYSYLFFIYFLKTPSQPMGITVFFNYI